MMHVEHRFDSGVTVLKPDRFFKDPRGYFLEATREDSSVIKSLPGYAPLIQTNVSGSVPFTLRGMHYQLCAKNALGQGKLMRCLRGKIYQVCVDMRAGYPTLGTYYSKVLDDIDNEAVWVPPGFANGFMAYELGAIVLYQMSAPYDETLERTLAWNDQHVGIKWPFRGGGSLVISPKDREGLSFNALERWS